MKPLEKVALFACLLLSALNFIGGGSREEDPTGESPSKFLDRSANRIEAEERNPWISVEHGRFRYHLYNGHLQSLSVDGIPYRIGQQTDAGTVLSVTFDCVHIMDATGNSTFLYPDHAYKYEVPSGQTTVRPVNTVKGATDAGNQDRVQG